MPPSVRIPVRVAGTGSVPAGPAISTAELIEKTAVKLDAREVEAKTGIVSRHFAGREATAAELGARALSEALAAAGIPAAALRRLVLVSSVGGDVLVPATANLVAAALGLRGTCDCFDLNNGCMGFLSAFDIAARGVAMGEGPVGIVVAELASRFIRPDDLRPFLVVGDGIAAAVLDEGRGGEGILGVWLRNDGTGAGDITLAHPGLTGRRETVRFVTPNKEMERLAITAVRESAEAVLSQARLALADVQWVLPHQPNGALLATMLEALGVDPARTVAVVREVGSVGAASIPLSLDRLVRSGRLQPGDHILMVGVGVGRSYGAILLRVAP